MIKKTELELKTLNQLIDKIEKTSKNSATSFNLQEIKRRRESLINP